MTDQIGEKNDRAVEQGNNDEVASGEIPLQLAGEASHAARDLLLGNEHPLNFLLPVVWFAAFHFLPSARSISTASESAFRFDRMYEASLAFLPLPRCASKS